MYEAIDQEEYISTCCTCTTDKEITCIVHPTERALHELITDQQIIITAQRFHISDLMNNLRDSWKPINTAPRDKRILLQGAHGDIADGWWAGMGWSWPYINKEPCYWRELESNEDN